MTTVRTQINTELQRLTNHHFIELTTRGNTAITAALSLLPKEKTLLIPEEGGWLSYHNIPKEQHLTIQEVRCNDSAIDIHDLRQKLELGTCSALLYQNPGGYFAEQPMKEIFTLCKNYNCLVIMDVSGSVGTLLCDGRYADILVCSFGKWKLVDAYTGGFISCKERVLFEQLKDVTALVDEEKLTKIYAKLQELPKRISFLLEKRTKIMKDLTQFPIFHKNTLGFVVVVPFSSETEKENIIAYCTTEHLPYTICPRYIRLNRPAISIEVKQIVA
ncbi:MAG: aminotransferase class I/II-fold pyridoxal phosphate-dependent enzyme [Nanoarchaeota archaeon]